MTLEEKIIFYSREDAAEFQKYLKEKGCSARISVEHVFSGTPYFEGTISAFLSLIDTLTAREPDADLEQLKSDLLERENTLAEFFATHKVGDILTDMSPSQLLAQFESIDTTGNDNIQQKAAEKFVNFLMVLGTLEDNNLLEETPGEGTDQTLTGTMEPSDMRVMYAYTDLPGTESEDLESSGITSHIRTSSETHYIVTTGCEVVFVSDMDDVSSLLDNLDVDDDEAARFCDALFFKQALIAKIHELVSDGFSTETNLLKAFNAPSFPLGETSDVISFDLSAEYLSGVLADLRKQGMIKGRDGKIKNT